MGESFEENQNLASTQFLSHMNNGIKRRRQNRPQRTSGIQTRTPAESAEGQAARYAVCRIQEEKMSESWAALQEENCEAVRKSHGELKTLVFKKQKTKWGRSVEDPSDQTVFPENTLP